MHQFGTRAKDMAMDFDRRTPESFAKFISGALLLAIVMMLGCGQPPSSIEIEHQNKLASLNWILHADPDEDLLDAIDDKDLRFRGTYGYSLKVPSIPFSCIDTERDVKVIEGTSDALSGYEHAKLDAIANTYAFYYNIKLRSYLERHGLFECAS